jgi:Flp pilus assembly pilin Flp
MKYSLIGLPKKRLSLFKFKEKGATMVEYSIMIVLIALVSIAIVSGLGKEVSTVFGRASNSMVEMNG